MESHVENVLAYGVYKLESAADLKSEQPIYPATADQDLQRCAEEPI